jgi:DNA-binding NarL/FixJ family response regulator
LVSGSPIQVQVTTPVVTICAITAQLRMRTKRGKKMYVLLADSDGKERAALRRLMAQEPELTVVGEAIGARELLAQAQALHPDLVLLDWELPGLQGTDLLLALHCHGWPMKVVAYSERTEARQEALAGGADAFVGRDEPLEWLLITLYSVAGLSPCFVG